MQISKPRPEAQSASLAGKSLVAIWEALLQDGALIKTSRRLPLASDQTWAVAVDGAFDISLQDFLKGVNDSGLLL